MMLTGITILKKSTLFFLLSFWGIACQKAHSSQQVKTQTIPDTIPVAIEDTLTSQSLLLDIDTDYLMGRFDPSTHADFELIDPVHADRQGMYLRRDAYEAFKAMYAHALQDGLRLQIRSATRNFYAQKSIWEAKWTGQRLIESGENLAETTPDSKERALKILRYSSMPGSSRHHWGTDIDLNSFENSWFEAGEGLNIYKWLQMHAATYGYCQPYTAGRPYGYFEERWHWSFIPVSARLTAYAREHLKNEMISGFEGSEAAPLIDVVKHYVLGINSDCGVGLE